MSNTPINFYHKLYEHIPVASCIIDKNWNILGVNAEFKEQFGAISLPKKKLDSWLTDFGVYEEDVNESISLLKRLILAKKTKSAGILTVKNKSQKEIKVEILSFSIEGLFVLIFKEIIDPMLNNEDELRYKHLSDLTFEGILIHQDGVALDVNEAFVKIFGYERLEFIGQNLIELLGEEKDRETMYKNMRDNYPYPYEVNALKKSGEKFPAEISGREITHNGKKARLISIRDISDRKNREKQLSEHQLLIQKITEQSPDIIYIYDIKKKRNVFMNKDLRLVLGYEKSELPENSSEIVKKLIHPDDYIQFDEFYGKSSNLKNDFVFEFTYRLKAKDGTWRWFAGKEKEFQKENDRVVTVIGTLLDITLQKNYENALIKSEEQLSTIFENAPMIMVLLNQDGSILKMNKNSVLKSNDSNSMFIGDVFNCINSVNKLSGCGFGLQCEKCTVNTIIKKTFSSKKNYHKVEARLRIKNGGYDKNTYFLVSTKLMSYSPPLQVLVTLDDITERKLMEFDLKEAKEKAEESNKLKTAFLQNMSHEIRTPMNGIIGFSDMLIREELSDKKRELYTNIIVQSSKQLLSIVNDILDISKIETGQAETDESETNINQLIGDLFNFYKPLAWKKKLSIFVSMPLSNEDSFIWIDYHKLKQVLENLLSNALKFTHEGYLRFGYRFSSNELIFYVEDTGIGIKKEYHEKIFEQFRQIELTTTREYGGTGLGLAITRAYVKLLGGKIWLISTKNKGTVFYFTIPYNRVLMEDILENNLEHSDKPQITRNKSVLVAEDEYTNFMLLKELLQELGVEVFHAKNGTEAIKMAEKTDISLVLLDIKMPRLNGFEAIKEIKKSKPFLPVVAQTAFATSNDKDLILDAEFDDYLAKPIQNEALYTVLEKYLGIRAKKTD